MSNNATFTVGVSQVCEDRDCVAPASHAFFISAQYGTDGIAVYCDLHAEDKETSDAHSELGEVVHE